MKKITNLIMLALIATLGWQANAQDGGDTCADAVVVTPGVYDASGIGTNGSATNAGGTNAIWYSYTPSADGTIDINSCATTTDTRIYVYDGDCAALNVLANNDDACGLASTVSVAVSSGVEYTIEWDDRWSDAAFSWELTYTGPAPPAPGDSCASAIPAVPGVYNTDGIGSNGSATNAGATDALWYSYIPGADGTMDINSCATTTDTRIYVYDGNCAALNMLANNDDDCGLGSSITVEVSSGTEYLIEWDDRWSDAAFTWELNLTPAPLDPTVLPITLENQLPIFGDFNGSFTQAIANPDASGANTSATVAENTVPANAAFAGVNFGLDTNIDISTQKGFTMTVWSPVANTPVLLKLENATTGVNAERAATTTTTGAWETLSFDFSAEGDLTFESVTIFMNFNVTDPATQVYYWDNLEQVDVLITGGAQIVEIDADQTGTDDQEFVEIKTEFANQSLDGMIAVFYNGSSDASYRTVDLSGFASDENGYFLLGSDAVAGADITMGPDNTIQNGADAVALHMANAANFPDGTAATDAGLVDAVVYGTSDADDDGLLAALGQSIQWDENENGAKDTESLQFDATTGAFCAQVPTPRAANTPCPVLSDGLSCPTALVAVPGVYNDVAITEGTGSATEGDQLSALWYVYTAEDDGSININSCASDPAGIDTRLWVWTDGCDTLTAVATDDDGCDDPNGFGSLLTDIAVVGGQEYLIEWDDRWGADAFDWELTFTPAPAPVVELPITFEDGQTPVFADFNGSFTEIVENGGQDDTNPSLLAALNTVPAGAEFAGVNFPVAVDITTLKGLSMDVFTFGEENVPVLLKLENNDGNDATNSEVLAVTTGTDFAWETITFDFSGVTQLTYDSVTIFMNFNTGNGNPELDMAWDNLEQIEVLGLNNNVIEGFTFYPNPSLDVINLTAKENIERVSIYNMLGQKVIDQNINAISSQIDVANLVTGTYFMLVSADGKTASHKVIKK